MVPVRLRLKNFLSYGTAAEELDFNAFHVACLSGGNGQGKSALLDAITWAVWGEARKSAGAVKPDEELLRVGAREMEVELVFDLEGTRYRVVRSYTVTASGKTSKPGLELAVLDGEGGEWRPLTSENVRATQAEIERRVGLDYDTFINSAFLLQGRSDEFTKKKPAERKEVLARVLGLERYERLAARASERYSEARDRVRRGEEAVERLGKAVEGESEWKEEHDATAAIVTERAEERDRLRAEESALGERLAALDAEARRVETHRDALAALDARRARLDAEEAGLVERLTEAEAVAARADQIQADHTRHETLTAERTALDEKAELRRGLDGQVQQLRLQVERAQMEQQTQLNRLDNDLRADRLRLAEDERAVAERPTAEAGLRRAEEAARLFTQLKAQADERARLRERVEGLDKRIANELGRAQGQLSSLRARLHEAEGAPPRDVLVGEIAVLEGHAAAAEGLRKDLDGVREAGGDAKAAQEATEMEVRRIEEAISEVEAKRVLVRSTESDTCPTCGTDLTEEHRRTVEATYGAELRDLAARRLARQKEVEGHAARREELRNRYREVQEGVRRAEAAAEGLADARARLRRLDEDREALERMRGEAADLEARIARAAFLPDVQAERLELVERLEREPFDEAAFEAAREEAVHRARWREKLAELDTVAERLRERAAKVERTEAEATRLRDDMAQGTSLGPLRDRLGLVEKQIAGVGYDGARHEEVRRQLTALSGAPQAVTRLLGAQRELADGARRRLALADERAGVDVDAAGHRAAIDASADVLAERPGLLEQVGAVKTRRGDVEGVLSDAQARLGALRERLARCAADRAMLRDERAALKLARNDAAIARHLRQAFGRHGIPSLIIEETLPQVEEAANALLERLSGGRTRVALETTKDKKAGGTKETLEITITDEQGKARSYETYSGGEAFRVNFALRIALAQLLAERAGVRIRTLVIDEGFGTQDQEGLQSLVEAIRAIQDDFDKIIVITHLEELKAAFPVRIEVTKRPVEGSTFEVIGI